MDVINLEEAQDQLYGSSLDAFVSERARLVKELRAVELRDDAATLAKSRKPSVAAWVLNQLARRERRDVDLLLDAGHRLREAQAGALSGEDREAFEQAQKNQIDALRRLTAAAGRLLKEERGGGAASVLGKVEEALRAAAISETGREMLARGRFVEPPQAEGFDVVSEVAGTAPPRPRTRQKPAAGQAELREATARLKKARARLSEAERTAGQAEREAYRVSREAEQTRSRAETARAHADAAARDVEDAERTLKRAKRT